jgi:hypothetical protein
MPYNEYELSHKDYRTQSSIESKYIKPYREKEHIEDEECILYNTKNVLGIKNHNNNKLNKEDYNDTIQDYSSNIYQCQDYIRRIQFLEKELIEKDKLVNMMKMDISQILCEKDVLSSEIRDYKNKINYFEEELIVNKTNKEDLDDFKIKMYRLNNDFNELNIKFEKSEKIRHEQNRLIYSLQNEVDYLREKQIEKIKTKKTSKVKLVAKQEKTTENPFLNNKSSEKEQAKQTKSMSKTKPVKKVKKVKKK